MSSTGGLGRSFSKSALPVIETWLYGSNRVDVPRRCWRSRRHRRPAAGISSIASKPWTRHPVRKSHVWASATVRISGGDTPRRQRSSVQPSNHHEDENGSMPPYRRSMLLAVPTGVLQYVAERSAGLTRRLDDLEVITVLEHLADPPEHAVEATRDAHAPALDATRERDVVARFADQVDVIALDRELTDPERVLAAAVDERAAQHGA